MKKEYYDWPWEHMDTIPVDRELNTLLRLNSEFPLAVSHDDLAKYKNGFVNWHKKSTLELSIVTEGCVTVNLLNHQEQVHTGEGFLIFPGILHSIRSDEKIRTGRYETLIWDPCLLNGFRGSYFEKNYYKPEVINRNGFTHFSVEKGPLKTCASELGEIFQDDYWGDVRRENQIQHRLQEVWITLWERVIMVQTERFHKTDDVRLFQMIEFLQKNYQKKFDLDELCAHVNLSRSACCRYFKKMMNMSISDYILEYRMSQALFMLGNSDKSITEIAFQSGFSSTSYFITRFREKMGMTPLEYKRKES